MKQPLPILPQKPIKFYPFHQLDNKSYILDENKNIEFYSDNLMQLEPHNTDIYIVIKENSINKLQQVTFFKDPTE